LAFDVRDTGPPGGEAVVLLHGFPQSAASWSQVAPDLAEAGFRVLAPDQRGYSPGARPTGREAYRIDKLVGDVLALADAAGAERIHLVGHDWGGAVAWAVAAAHPDRLHSLTVLSTPHPKAFRQALTSSGQALRSYYMAFFQLPEVPERLLLARRGWLLKRQLQQMGLDAGLAAEHVGRMLEPGALTAALNWYRAVRVRSIDDVHVPTLYIWSTKDAALGRRAAELTGEHVKAPYRFEVLDGVSHWIPEQRPHDVAKLLLDHIRRTA
ncbi:MAG TPA: alpha/beta fold hydrolase, partial [Acidimicrobiales bacterium]|nr:alpha/beta fold hydrolase [Acidimicrobiales bacterium]